MTALRTDYWFWSPGAISFEQSKDFTEEIDDDFYEVLAEFDTDDYDYHLPGGHILCDDYDYGFDHDPRKRTLKSVSLKKIKDRVWTGNRKDIKSEMTKLQAGDLGERIVVSWLRRRGFNDADSLNNIGNNFPVDIGHNHEVLEVKAGLISNTRKSWHWRSTIGEPGPKEKLWLKEIDAETKAAWGEKKTKAILARKKKILRDFTSDFGKKVVGKTATVIIDPDTQTADLFMFDGFHKRIGWNSEKARESYVGSFEYTPELSKEFHQPGGHDQKRHAGGNREISNEEMKEAVLEYAGEDGMPFLNALRLGAVDVSRTWQKTRDGLDALFEMIKPTSSEMTVWRGLEGISGSELLKRGNILTDKAYIASSLDRDMAEVFAGAGLAEESVLFKIIIPEGSSVIDVDKFLTGSSESGGEREVILPRNSKLLLGPLESIPTNTIEAFKIPDMITATLLK